MLSYLVVYGFEFDGAGLLEGARCAAAKHTAAHNERMKIAKLFIFKSKSSETILSKKKKMIRTNTARKKFDDWCSQTNSSRRHVLPYKRVFQDVLPQTSYEIRAISLHVCGQLVFGRRLLRWYLMVLLTFTVNSLMSFLPPSFLSWSSSLNIFALVFLVRWYIACIPTSEFIHLRSSME